MENQDRRTILQAEWTTIMPDFMTLLAMNYTLMLNPKDVYGPDFPGETSRALKEKEEREYGEYRTRRLVLEAWDTMERGT